MAYRRSPRVADKLANKRERILQAARRLVAEGGWREAQMASVAAAAGLATGTVYRYFPSKAELFAEVLARVSRREVEVIGAIAASDGSAAERLAGAVRAFCLRALKGRRLAYALIAEPCEPEIDQARLVYRRAIAEQFMGLVTQGIAAGEFASQDARVSASCVVGAFMEALVGPLAPEATELDGDGGAFVTEVIARCMGAVAQAARDPVPLRAVLHHTGKPPARTRS